MPQVTIPGVGPVNFPDTMSSEDINGAAKRLYDEHNMYAANQTAAEAPAPSSMLDATPGGDVVMENLKAGIRNAPEFAGGVVKGTAMAAPRAVAGIYQAVRHPIDTATGLANAAMHPSEVVAGLNKQLSTPVGMGDFVGGMVAPSIIPPVMEVVGEAAHAGLKAIGVASYARGLKPGLLEAKNLPKTDIGYIPPTQKVEDLAKFGLDKGLTSPAKAETLVGTAGQAITAHPSMADAAVNGETAHDFVARSVQDVTAGLGNQAINEKDLSTVQRVLDEFQASHPEELTRARALEIAQATDKGLRNAYSATSVPPAEMAAKQAISQGLRDFVKADNPDVQGLMGEQSRAIRIKSLLEKQELKAANRTPVGLPELLAGAAGGMHSIPAALASIGAVGGMDAILHNPIPVGVAANALGEGAGAVGWVGSHVANNPTLKALQRGLLLDELRKRSGQ